MAKATCSIDGCEKPAWARGWCPAHLRRWQRHGDPLGGGVCRSTRPDSCTIEGCDAPVQGRGWCAKHYMRWVDHGDPNYEPWSVMIERFFWPKVDKHGPVSTYRPDLGPCWIWTGTINVESGYGYYSMTPAHRVAYQELVGEIPAGLDLDHLCMVRACVRPTHLEPVTRAENLRRAREAAASRKVIA